jgi:hypothetical protein
MSRDGFFEAVAVPADVAAFRDLAARLKAGMWSNSGPDRMAFAVPLAHCAFAAPDRIAELYDAAAEGWFGVPVNGPAIAGSGQPPLPFGPGLPADFWAVVDDAMAGKLDAGLITARTAALGGHLGDAYRARSIAAAHAYPAVTLSAAGDLPRRICLDELSRCPAGSLGAQFHALIVDNKFDLEVLDRDALGLSSLPKPLDWLNTRMLQSHDLWHIVAGYQTTALHEIAISAFQMAQFGHNYSAHFLAVMGAITAEGPPEGWGMVMDVILSAWRHGRETPPLVAIPWEDVWNADVATLRIRYGITPYDSPYPADVLERIQAAA